MPIDPGAPLATTTEDRAAQKMADLARRLDALERGGFPVSIGNGPPTSDPNTLKEGSPYIDRTNRRIYYVVGINPAAAWRYAALT